jgi:carbon starvation protein
MFEALFILTTIDAVPASRDRAAGVRRSGLEASRPNYLFVARVGLHLTGSINTIWPMFGIANQPPAAVALAVGTTIIINIGRASMRITFVPLLRPDDDLTAGYERPRQLLRGVGLTRRRCRYVDSICTVI